MSQMLRFNAHAPSLSNTLTRKISENIGRLIGAFDIVGYVIIFVIWPLIPLPKDGPTFDHKLCALWVGKNSNEWGCGQFGRWFHSHSLPELSALFQYKRSQICTVRPLQVWTFECLTWVMKRHHKSFASHEIVEWNDPNPTGKQDSRNQNSFATVCSWENNQGSISGGFHICNSSIQIDITVLMRLRGSVKE